MDGKNQATTWGYDSYGRVTSRTNAANAQIPTYAYDADSRLTNMVDGVGTTSFGYFLGGEPETEAQPWASSTCELAGREPRVLSGSTGGLGRGRRAWPTGGCPQAPLPARTPGLLSGAGA